VNVWGVHFENSAVGGYRLWMPFDALNRSGLAECRRLPDDMALSKMELEGNFPNSLETAGRWADLLVYQRMDTLLNLSIAVSLAQYCGKPFVAEMDDNLFAVPSTMNAYKHYRPSLPGENLSVERIPEGKEDLYKGRKDGVIERRPDGSLVFVTQKYISCRAVAEEFLKEADGVTTTTPYLADVFRNYNPYVYVLPNCIEVDRWKRLSVAPHDGVRVGWFGGMQHYEDLEVIEEVVPEVLKRRPNVTFVTTVAIPDFWRKMFDTGHPQFKTVAFAPFQAWPEYLAQQGCDILLAPLRDNPFNRAKSNIKWLEAGALGTPVVASPINAYADIEHERTGLLARTKDEWIECILRLVDRSGEREEIGLAAREKVYAGWDINRRAKEWALCYHDVEKRARGYRQRGKVAM